MSRKPLVNTRVERDTKEAIDGYTDTLGEDVSDSEAIRHLLRAGLAEKGHPVATADGGSVRYIDDTFLERLGSMRTVGIATATVIISTVLLSLASWLAGAGETLFAIVALLLAVMTMTIATILTCLAALAQLALARPLRGLVGLGDGETA